MLSLRMRTVLGAAFAVAGLFLAPTSNAAGYLGDDVTATLIVHTTGAVDQNVVIADTQTVGVLVEWAGDSQPAGAADPLLWNLDFTGPDFTCFVLSVEDVNGIGPTTVDPITLTLTGLDALGPIPNVVIGGINTFGFVAGDISWTADSVTITVPAGALAVLANGGVLVTEFCIVPEVSTVVMMGMAVSGIAGASFLRRRRAA